MYMEITFILSVLPSLYSQSAESLFFPDETGGIVHYETNVRIPMNVTEIEETWNGKSIKQIISGGIANMTLEINKSLKQKGAERGNIVFSPISIASALALLLLGSSGKTFDEIISVMGLTSGVDVQRHSLQVHKQFARMISKLDSSSGFTVGHQINVATAIFVDNDYPIRRLYKQTAQDLYESEILNVEFQTNPSKVQEIINAWVSDRTRGKIRNILVDPPSDSTKVMITSALYFKAAWEKPFFEETTVRRPFYPNGKKSQTNIEVEMMANGGKFPYYKDFNLNCEILGLPYKGNLTTMYVVKPFDSNMEKLKELENILTPNDLEYFANSTVYTEVVLLFPKMKIESTLNLKTSLKHLGVKSIFNPAQANLALLSPGEDATSSNLSSKISFAEINPITPVHDQGDKILIVSRTGEIIECSNNAASCQSAVRGATAQQKVSYPKFTSRFGNYIRNIRSVNSEAESLDNLRDIINQQYSENKFQNPGLYADTVVHKVYMDITETGTEAAAAVSTALAKNGGSVSFRADVPFLFFIRNEETKTILFWGSVNTPTPSFPML